MRPLLATIGLVVFLAAPALGDHQGPHASPGSDYWGVSVTTETQPEESPAAAVAQASSQVSYTYHLACGDRDNDLRTDSFDCDPSSLRCGDDSGGLLYFRTIQHPDGSTEQRGPYCYDPEHVAEAAQQVDPGLALRAFERVPLPKSRVVVQPPGGVTLVGLDTVFSTRAERFTEVVRLLGRRVELDIRPSSYLWHRGDGTTERTSWAGRPWRQGDAVADLLTHVYDDRARVWTRVDTTWSARFRVGDGRWRPVPGTVTIEGEPTRLWVRSASPRLVGAANR